jgi:gamma-glutamyltranspeptidase/glutathione hydrolase
MVASAHPKASLVGLEVLKNGGTAVDAAIAVNAFLGVVEPTMCGVGGDLFAIVWSAQDKKLYGLNASGWAPANLNIEAVKAKYPSNVTMPVAAPESWTVPGAVAGWYALHGRFGKTPMAELLKPAIKAATDGEPVATVISQNWQWPGYFQLISKNAGFADTYLPNGAPPAAGQVFSNPKLAGTYSLLAKYGRDAFYNGQITDDVIAFSQKNGGYFTRADFSGFKEQWVTPLSANYRGFTVWELPPNGQGLATLQMLNILGTYDFKQLGWTHDNPDFWHVFIEAKKLVYEDMAKYYADPDFSKIPEAALLSAEHTAALKAMIKDQAAVIPDIHVPELPRIAAGDTTYITVADQYGNMVSLIESVYLPFGSGFAVDGFALQNRGALFSLDPNSPNKLEPHKRPFHTIIPGFVTTARGEPYMSFGVMGGSMQPQGQVEILVNMIDFGMNIQQAGDALRMVHSGSSGPDGSKPNFPLGAKPTDITGIVYAEDGFSNETREGLRAHGHTLMDESTYNQYPFLLRYTGGFQGILRDPQTGVYSGGSDPRKDGMAIGY